MNFLKKTIFPVLLSTIWIIISEFVRNEFLIKSYWTNHYQKLGIIFPSEPINGALWGVWSLAFAISIFIISKKFTFIQTAIISWIVGFVLMWLVIGNMGVLPDGLLFVAVPLSLIETFLASYIIKKLS
jgi:hypothetical protein